MLNINSFFFFFGIKIVTEGGKCGFQREILQNNAHLKKPSVLMAFNYSWFIKKKDLSKKISVLGSQHCFFKV